MQPATLSYVPHRHEAKELVTFVFVLVSDSSCNATIQTAVILVANLLVIPGPYNGKEETLLLAIFTDRVPSLSFSSGSR